MNLIIKKSQVSYDSAPQARHSEAGHQHERGAKLVTVAGVPRAIEVSCKCGESFVIELTFEESPE